MAQEKRAWPEEPYKGLSFYVPSDRALFAGRDEDVVRCAQLLAVHSTSVLMLHGRTGCGKSSFLRAGLIPFLERAGTGFKFLTEQFEDEAQTSGAARGKALFIRSTDAPLVKLAEAIWNFVEAGLEIQNPIGEIEQVDLPRALLDIETASEFQERVGTDVDLLMKSLSNLALVVPAKIVLIVDQGEEVLTLKQGRDGEEPRRLFFNFVRRFSGESIDLKLLIALRSEHYADFDDELQPTQGRGRSIERFKLHDLQRPDLVAAIKRPTLEDNLIGFGIPRDHYRFSYADGLPEQIADDLLQATPKGGTLPALQIVCGRLYRQTREGVEDGQEAKVTFDRYHELGGVGGQVQAHARDILEQLCEDHDVPAHAVEGELQAWVKVLTMLFRVRVDGTVTTELAREKTLREEARVQKTRIKFDRAIEFLKHDKQRMVQPVEQFDFSTKSTVLCYTLGHDAIGLALSGWSEQIDKDREIARQWKRGAKWSSVMMLVLALVGVSIFKFFDTSEWVLGLGIVCAVYAVTFGVNFLFGYQRVMRWQAMYRGELSSLFSPKTLVRMMKFNPYIRRVVEDSPTLSRRVERHREAVRESAQADS